MLRLAQQSPQAAMLSSQAPMNRFVPRVGTAAGNSCVGRFSSPSIREPIVRKTACCKKSARPFLPFVHCQCVKQLRVIRAAGAAIRPECGNALLSCNFGAGQSLGQCSQKQALQPSEGPRELSLPRQSYMRSAPRTPLWRAPVRAESDTGPCMSSWFPADWADARATGSLESATRRGPVYQRRG